MFTLNCKGRLFHFHRPVIMGILNTTPDSFYEGSRFMGEEGILQQAEKMKSDGALIIDIGGQSTRPGSERISAGEEITRVIGAIESIHYNFPELIISIDTYHAVVARAAVEAGAGIVNDISGGMYDKAMIETVASLKVPFVCTHAPGEAGTMHQNPGYGNVTTEVFDFLVRQSGRCREAGINDVIIDPGIGFGKNIDQNFEIINNLEKFSIINRPLLLGVSRKGTIYRKLGITPEQAVNGTTVLNTVGLLKGAAILRVHDVKQAIEAIVLTESLKEAGGNGFNQGSSAM
ncbi:MAG: dihydropteroate synthase [Chitinophagaceae bacterium]|nr:MAG: dihydropteroate synthase [Chitinophagaceae bacterium]